MSKISKCNGCGAPIRFEYTKNGNKMPCDPKAIYYIPDREGNICVLTNAGEVIKAREGIEPKIKVRVGFIPHFGTCKARKSGKKKPVVTDTAKRAEAYRRKKEAEEAAEQERIARRCAEIDAEYKESQRVKQLSLLPDDFYGWTRR